jgi:2-polyprenyl-3-methyl-5-hydroxy-6-metoxy-1,4-benzoquinol methylase
MQNKSNRIYSKLAKLKNVRPTEKAGRYKFHEGKEILIFNDIKKKLIFKKNDNFLDIGCGCGPLTDLLVNYCQKKNIYLTLCDIPAVINELKKKYKKFKNIKYIDKEFQKTKIDKKFDKILCYSVIHIVDSPLNFSKKIISSINQKGKAFIGDITNINKKFRYLQSDFGRKNDKSNFPNKMTIQQFKRITKQNKKTHDDLILKILSYSRKHNKTSYVLKQPLNLPFSFTREDILVEEF